jgi:hypothetical protein
MVSVDTLSRDTVPLIVDICISSIHMNVPVL